MFKETRCTEILSDEQVIEKALGLALIKPDAVELGIEEFLTEYITGRMMREASAELAGGFIIESLSQKELRLVYPKLDDNNFKGHLRLFKQPSVLLAYTSRNFNYSSPNLWEIVKTIKGRVNVKSPDMGFTFNIRGAKPIPGTRYIYEMLGKKMNNSDVLTEDDYFHLSKNLVHSPDNLDEILGLSTFISDADLHEVLDNQIADLIIRKREIIEPIKGKES